MSIYNELYDWQQKIVDKNKDRQSYGLFLEQGLGKTPLSLAFAEVNDCKKVIIITLNNKTLETEETNGSWNYWIKKSSHPYNIIKKKSKDKSPSEYECLIYNYEGVYERVTGVNKRKDISLREDIENFIIRCKGERVALILDESHKIKNLSSHQTKAILEIQHQLKLLSKSLYTYLLTGTPFTVGYIDLYTQLKFLGYKESKTHFIERYCIKDNNPILLEYQQKIIAYKNIDELFDIIHQFALTIKSEEVVNLPEKIFINHTLPLTHEFSLFTTEKIRGTDILKELNKRGVSPQQYKNYDFNTKNKINNPFYKNIAYPHPDWLADTAGNLWLRCRELSIGFQGNAGNYQWFNNERLNALKEFIEEHENNYIIFYNYTPELFELTELFFSLGYNVDVYCGEYKSLYFYEKYSKQTEEEKFQNNKNVLIANYASGGTGMNWQEYNHCILFSLPLYKDYEQSIKRLHRIGQQKTVFYHIFLQDNWLEKRMKESLDKGIDYSLEMFESDLNKQNIIGEEENGTI